MPAGLIGLLRTPESVSGVALADWNDVVAQGRKTQLLGQLAVRLRQANVIEQVPEQVRRHLLLAELTARRRRESAMWEISAIRRAVDPAVPLVLLKGCAYAACADDNAGGRLFSDVDVMVRRQDLQSTQMALLAAGWMPNRVNDYDLKYYHDWMHEVPPMTHLRRRSVVDLHHAINPPVSRYHIKPDLLMKEITEVQPGLFVLNATDRVIHCALHLLQEGEPKKLLRDLYDLHLLLCQHQRQDGGRQQLGQRARELGVQGVVEASASAAEALFSTRSIDNTGSRGGLLHACMVRAAVGAVVKPSIAGGLTGTAMLAYSHWMKMPVHLLIPHLARKSLTQFTTDKKAPT